MIWSAAYALSGLSLPFLAFACSGSRKEKLWGGQRIFRYSSGMVLTPRTLGTGKHVTPGLQVRSRYQFPWNLVKTGALQTHLKSNALPILELRRYCALPI